MKLKKINLIDIWYFRKNKVIAVTSYKAGKIIRNNITYDINENSNNLLFCPGQKLFKYSNKCDFFLLPFFTY